MKEDTKEKLDADMRKLMEDAAKLDHREIYLRVRDITNRIDNWRGQLDARAAELAMKLRSQGHGDIADTCELVIAMLNVQA